jgi:hypothetical protein
MCACPATPPSALNLAAVTAIALSWHGTTVSSARLCHRVGEQPGGSLPAPTRFAQCKISDGIKSPVVPWPK